MEFIESKHFMQRWRERVGKEYKKHRLQRLIEQSVKAGHCRRQRNKRLGIMIPITTDQGQKVYITGAPVGHKEFLLKTVLTESMACTMKWIPTRNDDSENQHR